MSNFLPARHTVERFSIISDSKGKANTPAALMSTPANKSFQATSP